MKKKTNHNRKYKFTYIKTTAMTLFCCMLFLKGHTPFEKTGDNYFHIMLNGQAVGTLGDREQAEELLVEARRGIASESDELVFLETDLQIAGEEVLWGKVDAERDVLANMDAVLRSDVQETMHRSYTLKVNEYMVNLASADDVRRLLQAAIDKYGNEGKFRVELVYDPGREFSVLTSNVVDTTLEQEGGANAHLEAGIQPVLSNMGATRVTEEEEKDFGDYELGLLSMDFAEDVEIVEAYLPESQLTELSEAIERVIKEQEVPGEYEVVKGDTLSEIAIKVNIPMDRIIEMNDSLEDENTTLQIGQKLVITVPEPELSVVRVEEYDYEEIYDADIIYIENDDWYTNHQVVHVQPSAGFRRVVADVSYLNDREVDREILKEDIIKEAVAKVVERGTRIPPTYIRPISGGRQSSGFGKRPAPKKGASTYHKGVDWATPTGTPVYASCGGTVTRAGWGSGYGYVVYIDHEDGRQTRYGHLSKVLVSVGDTVKQGERIALSGNTGVSTGPHLHFEILINGTQVNPLPLLE
ncbi:MAG: M23 family metallopeptidase [Lachnospiraceae bacterium]|nr:M23 family metallopeptidase [Butyrivibrio sp.]MCM1342484.1 M23 family metallopeptidase [Muribaculaceae bacterium]MCM1409455.1 M23 family metallopeptidase [Lachnospiraceae bacterium]